MHRSACIAATAREVPPTALASAHAVPEAPRDVPGPSPRGRVFPCGTPIAQTPRARVLAYCDSAHRDGAAGIVQAQLEAAQRDFRAAMPLAAAAVPLQPLLHIASAALTGAAPGADPRPAPPPGSAALRAASARDDQLQAAVRGIPAETAAAVESATRGSAAAAALTHRVLRLQGQVTGAHVVAPCAHDGICPMDRPGAAGWCHFSQRVERRHLHRQCAPASPCHHLHHHALRFPRSHAGRTRGSCSSNASIRSAFRPLDCVE